jgi:hypothetical protein
MNDRNLSGDSIFALVGQGSPPFALYATTPISAGVTTQAGGAPISIAPVTASGTAAVSTTAVPTMAQTIQLVGSDIMGLDWSTVTSSTVPATAVEMTSALAINSLYRSIAGKSTKAGDDRIILPGNLVTEMPTLFYRLEAAAHMAGVRIILDSSQNARCVHKSLFSLNAAERDTYVAGLTLPPNGPEMDALACVTVLNDALSIIPDQSAFAISGNGRLAAGYILHLIAGIYCEWAFSAPLAETRKWWKSTLSFREEMEKKVKGVFGDEKVSHTVITAIEILYRKFIRSLTHQYVDEATTPEIHKVVELGRAHTEKLTAKSSSMFMRNLRSETVEVTKYVADPTPKDPSRKKKVTQKQIGLLRPKLSTGPMTSWEDATLSRINAAMGKVETKFENFSFTKFSDPRQWDSKIKSVVDSLYQKTAVQSKQIASRKQYVRAQIAAERTKASLTPKTGGQGSQALPFGTISQQEWLLAVSAASSAKAAEWEVECVTAINQLLGRATLSKGDIDALSEDAILDILALNFKLA